jgi:NAD(P)H-dependent FMN reductase/ketosteroid isomerase-like protein
MSSTVLVIIGSLRKQSWSRRLANEIITRAAGKLDCNIVEIGDLPLYNEDLDSEPPTSWGHFRRAIDTHDAVLFVTPEYNRSIPGALKNALDVGSRPGNTNHWAGKPAAVVSQTPYKLGAFGANHALRQTFSFLDMPVLQQPEMYIGTIADKFDPDGNLTDPETAKLLDTFIDKFAVWIVKTRRSPREEAFEHFLKRRDEIATAYVNGDSGPLETIVTQTPPATFLAPNGESLTGVAALSERYANNASYFSTGGKSRLEVFNAASGQLAFWTGIQHAEARLKGKKELSVSALRVTEVFRLEGSEWKLIHRHADVGKPENETVPPRREY